MNDNSAHQKRKIRWKWVYLAAILCAVLAVILYRQYVINAAERTLAGGFPINSFAELEPGHIETAYVRHFRNEAEISEEEAARLAELLAKIRKTVANIQALYDGTSWRIVFTDGSSLYLVTYGSVCIFTMGVPGGSKVKMYRSGQSELDLMNLYRSTRHKYIK